jgi:hypothetical protein
MKKLSLVNMWGVATFIAAMGMASAANATVRFTYQSNQLTWLASVVNDQLFFDDGSTDKPFFSISFDAPDSWLTPGKRTEFSIPEPTVSIWNDDRPHTVSTDSYMPATIEIDADGSIYNWFFGYRVSPNFNPGDDPAVIAENKYYELVSTGEGSSSSCGGCDHFNIVTNYVGQGPNAQQGELYKIYTDGPAYNSRWSVTEIAGVPQISAVPEPASYAMLMGGLGLFGVMGWRKRAAFPRPMQAALT